MATITVIGAGYVGLVTGACLARLGHFVTCLEVDEQKLGRLQAGVLPIYEPGLDEIVNDSVTAGRLRFSGDYAGTLPAAEFAFIAVATPSGENGEADLSYVHTAVRQTLEHARPGLVLITKSTAPVGTGEDIARIVGASGLPGVEVASNPEFLRQGSAVSDFLNPDRIVVGAETPLVARRVARLYAGIEAPVVFTDRRSAELAKYAANAFLAARISFINEIAGVCEATGADIEEVSNIVGLDRRIGPAYLRAGLGWGGSCFPKDVLALTETARQSGCESTILDAVFDVNARQRERMFEQIREEVGPFGAVAVLGLAFKPHTDDLRGSPAIDIVGRLMEEGIDVRSHDPVAAPNAQRLLPNLATFQTPAEAIEGADVVLLATEWPEYLELDWRQAASLMRGNVVFDGRNVLDADTLTAAGLSYRGIGRRTSSGPSSSARQSPIQAQQAAAVGEVRQSR